MVSRIIISIALLCSSVAMSQEESALKFNQVLLVELTEEGVVVPEGKVWKVVSAVSDIHFTSGSSTDNSKTYFIVNNELNAAILQGGTTQFGSSSNVSNCSIFPMWLPTGTNLSPGNMVSALSIIEFNTD
jgi:hypothetical protein